MYWRSLCLLTVNCAFISVLWHAFNRNREQTYEYITLHVESCIKNLGSMKIQTNQLININYKILLNYLRMQIIQKLAIICTSN